MRYRIKGPIEDAITCHCNLCRKLHGHVSSYARFDRHDLSLLRDEGLRWYRMSDKTDRGFCKTCGTGLFWRPVRSDQMAVMPGTLDETGNMKTAGQIYCADKGDYYPLDPNIPDLGR
ncbi:GFA family protein [Thalassospira sp. MA62]|nr:GFA family protein [Thalassospira sp. MA62]